MATPKKDYRVTSRVRIDNKVRDIGEKVSLEDEVAAPIRHCLVKWTEADDKAAKESESPESQEQAEPRDRQARGKEQGGEAGGEK